MVTVNLNVEVPAKMVIMVTIMDNVVVHLQETTEILKKRHPQSKFTLEALAGISMIATLETCTQITAPFSMS